jgi:hypothetical protein
MPSGNVSFNNSNFSTNHGVIGAGVHATTGETAKKEMKNDKTNTCKSLTFLI